MVTALGCGLRFWRLARFNELVFDEVYFVQFAQNYLSGIASFDAHPPFGKYLIAVGIWLHRGLGTADVVGYRWMNALAGSSVPLVVMGLAHTIGRSRVSCNSDGRSSAGCDSADCDSAGCDSADRNRVSRDGERQHCQIQESRLRKKRLRTFVLLSGLFVATDGLFVVESRYGLINVYMVLLGLLGQWLWLLRSAGEVLEERTGGVRSRRRKIALGVLSGLCLGGAIATKWNGLGFTLSLFIWELGKKQRAWKETISTVISLFFYLIVVSSLFYWIIWLPHLWLSGESFWLTHSQLLSFHQRLSPEGHSACSRWFTWPLLIKPIAYWYEEQNGFAYTVNNMGNPALWWLSSATMLLMFGDRVYGLGKRMISRYARAEKTLTRDKSTETGVSACTAACTASTCTASFCLISYASSWLPWLLVNRCTFIYLYMPSAIFGFIGLAWVMSGWLHAHERWIRTMGWSVGIVILLAFFFWLPLSLGAPLSLESLRLRWWLKSWI